MKKLRVAALGLLVLSSPLVGQVSSELESALLPEVTQYGFADLVLVNGKIVSMDNADNNDNPGTVYEAMAVKTDRIMGLGTSAEVRKMASSATRVVDLKGRTLIPGIIDTHSHLYGIERSAGELGIDLPFAMAIPEGNTLEETRVNIFKALQDASKEVEPGNWIVATMVRPREKGAVHPKNSQSYYWAKEGRLAPREFLDGAVRTRPILVKVVNQGFLNSAGLEMANQYMPGFSDFINEAYYDTAEERGWLGSQELNSLTWEIFLDGQPLETLAEGIRRRLERVVPKGVTTFSTRIPMPTIISAFVHLDANNKMPIRLSGHFETHRRAASPDFIRNFYKQTGALSGLGSDYFWIDGAASELWDGSAAWTCMGPDVGAAPEIKARERCPAPGSFYWDVLKSAVAANWRPAGVHGVGSHGARLFTQMLDDVVEEEGLTAADIAKRRPTMEHATFLGAQPDVLRKLKEYGIIVSVAPRFDEATGLIPDYNPEIERFAIPVRSLLEAGIRVVGQGIASAPGALMSMFVTREIHGRKLNPEEAVDRVRVMKMFTRWAAEYVLREDKLGSLEKGKLADFVILDKDYFSVPVDEIRQIVPLMTVVGGHIRFLHRDLARELSMNVVGFQSENPSPWDELRRE